MSFRVVARVLDDIERYPVANTKLVVLLILASWSNDDGEVVFSTATIKRIAQAARISPKRAEAVVAELVEMGLLTRELVPGKPSRTVVTGPHTPLGNEAPLGNEGGGISKGGAPSNPRGGASNSKGTKGKPCQEGKELQDLTPATEEEEAGADPTASPDSPHDSTTSSNGNQENQIEPDLKNPLHGLPASKVKKKMREMRAWDSEIGAVMAHNPPWEALIEWIATRTVPERPAAGTAPRPPRRNGIEQHEANLAKIRSFIRD